ncbi:MAG: hypothetical protein B193_1887 [Solidesulfovibrio magneticus str. Maddingley MBC34]|uniref:DUF4881 domain-containing protein n=1 Tax=Solidesulfovibrio magneticus str. Maddingley MBC34 TaxID=1206767 RepID=K6FLG2_9BACT|nr:MAG: hypothetical protein B193_1887 [Solidesulfovibrio magneticus str. Maddingley MBC34]
MRNMLKNMLLAALPVVFLAGCVDYGKVDQGRTVAVDKEKKTVTFIRDKANDAQKPDYTYLPALTYAIPTNPAEMGAEPKAGLRMKLDADKSQIVLYDPKKQSFETINIQIVDKQEGIDGKHPLVYDAAADKAKQFPALDKDKKTVSIYSGRQKLLVTFLVPEQYESLPASAWDSGDEVRVYYKEDGKAIRLMNVTKTNIFKK